MHTRFPAGVRPPSPTQSVFVALAYGVLSCLWILVSDEFVAKLGLSPDATALASILKGFLYVVVTSAIIYRLVHRLRQINGSLEQIVSIRTEALASSEAFLRKTQERFEQLLANLPDVTWTAAKDGRTTYISPNVEALFGFTAEDICENGADPWLAYIHPDDQGRISKAYERLFVTGDAFDVEYRVQSKGGQWMWVRDRAVGTHDVDGARFADGILSDITDRKRAEEARDESERRYRSLFERIPSGVFRCTIDGKILDCNPALIRMFGYSPSDEAPTTYSSGVFFDAADGLRGREKLLAEQVLTNFEVKLKRKDGTPLWALENVSLVPNDCDGPDIMEGTLIDITDRKIMEEELRIQRETSERQVQLLGTLLGEAPVELAMFDRNMCYLEASHRWCTHYGLDRELILGKSHYDIFPNAPPEWVEAHRRGMAGEVVRAERDFFVALGGKESLVRWEIRPWGDAGTSTGGIIIFSEDVTEQCQLERQFLKAQRMEAVGQLAAGVAHNFNNMLTVIMGSAQLIEGSPSDPEHVMRFAKKIVEAARHSGSLASQLLTFSSRHATQVELADLNSVVSDVSDMLKSLLAENIQLVIEPTASAAMVRISRAQLEQVIMNLAINAQDAMPDGGKLTLKTLEFFTDTKLSQRYGPDVTPGDYVMLSVTDTGCGMDEETCARIFEPFFTTKPVGKGTGLGLATVYGALKQCNGFISVESELGEGTCFRLYLLPAKSVHRGLSRPVESAVQGNEKVSVLVVEDEPDVGAAIAAYLTALGYEVLSAEDGEKALHVAEARKGTINLLLTDVVMPRMGGVELARHLSLIRPETKTVFMSGYIDLSLGAEELRNMNVLQKPFELSVLSQTIRDALRA